MPSGRKPYSEIVDFETLPLRIRSKNAIAGTPAATGSNRVAYGANLRDLNFLPQCALLFLSSVPSQEGETGMRCGKSLPNAAAAPATVSGHSRSN